MTDKQFETLSKYAKAFYKKDDITVLQFCEFVKWLNPSLLKQHGTPDWKK